MIVQTISSLNINIKQFLRQKTGNINHAGPGNIMRYELLQALSRVTTAYRWWSSKIDPELTILLLLIKLAQK